MRISGSVSILSLVFLCLCVHPAKADPILLGSGAASVNITTGFKSNSISGSGQDLQFQAFDNFDCGISCGPANQGTITFVGSGHITYQGVSYSGFTMSFSFTEDTLTGGINVFSQQQLPPPGTPPLFHLDLIGFGIGTFTDDQMGNRTGHFQITNTPEPTTLLLLGTGLSGIVIKIRGRKRSGRT